MTENDRDPWSSAQIRLQEREERVSRALQSGDESLLQSSRDRALYARELARLGKWERAEEVGKSIEEPEERYGTLAALARHRIKQGDNVAGLELLSSIPEDPAHADALHEKLDVLTKAAAGLAGEEQDLAFRLTEDALRALEVLKLASAPWVEPHYLLAIGHVLWSLSRREAAIELWERARIRALKSGDDMDCHKLLGDIALAFIKAGDRMRAEQLLPSITLDAVRSRVLEALGESLDYVQG